MQSLMRYPGGKGKISKTIIDKINSIINGRVVKYIEPFLGAGSIALNVLSSKSTIQSMQLNDRDYSLMCLWKAIQFSPEDIKNKVIDFVPTVESFYEYKDILQNQAYCCGDIDLAFMKLAIHQLSYSGLGTKSGGPLGGKEQISRYKIDCRWSPKYICHKIDEFHKLFQDNDVEFTSLDFQYVLSTLKTGHIVYLDPPYYIKGEELYQHSFSIVDHLRLRNLLREADYDWLLSYDDCEQIRNLYDWANITEIDINYTITGSRSKKELLISKL